MNDFHRPHLDLNLLVTFELLMETRSVTLAAERLNKTPSAVSHALKRLREQLDDPLLVSVGGAMQPSPFALELIDKLRPVLRTIQRIVQPPEPFVPADSHRVFRLAVPAIPDLVSKVTRKIAGMAPNVGMEWVPIGTKVYAATIEEQVDIAWYSADAALPEGLTQICTPPLKRYVFARCGHPGIANWSREEWLRWPHVVVGMAGAARQTVEKRIAQVGLERRTGAVVPEFSSVGSIVAGSDMLANQIPIMLGGNIEELDLQILEPPVDLPDFAPRFFWSARSSNDPGNKWFRNQVIEAYTELVDELDAVIRSRDVIQSSGSDAPAGS